MIADPTSKIMAASSAPSIAAKSKMPSDDVTIEKQRLAGIDA